MRPRTSIPDMEARDRRRAERERREARRGKRAQTHAALAKDRDRASIEEKQS